MSGGKRFAITVVCFGGVVLGYWLVQTQIGDGSVRSQIVAGLIAYVATIAAMVVFRQLQGRLSYVGYTLMSASTLPVLLSALNIAKQLGQSFYLTIIAIVVPFVLLMHLLERVLYTPAERAQLRNVSTGRLAEASKQQDGDKPSSGASR